MKNDVLICESINKCTNKNHSISHCHCHSFVNTSSQRFNFANYYQFGKLNFYYFLGGHHGYINNIPTQNKQILLEMTFSCDFNRECGIAHIAMPHSPKVNKTTTLTTAKRVMGAHFFLNTPTSSNQVSKLTMLSVVTEPPDITQLYGWIFSFKG